MKISVVGMPWYRKADYARLRASFADGARLHQTYAEWSAAARATEAHLAAQGHRAVRVEFDPEEFVAWCSALNVVPDAEARIAADKLTGYLLNVSHKRGSPKARVRVNFGYRSDNPHALESACELSTFARCDPDACECVRRRLRDPR